MTAAALTGGTVIVPQSFTAVLNLFQVTLQHPPAAPVPNLATYSMGKEIGAPALRAVSRTLLKPWHRANPQKVGPLSNGHSSCRRRTHLTPLGYASIVVTIIITVAFLVHSLCGCLCPGAHQWSALWTSGTLRLSVLTSACPACTWTCICPVDFPVIKLFSCQRSWQLSHDIGLLMQLEQPLQS